MANREDTALRQITAEALAEKLTAEPIGWIVDEAGKLWPPFHPHSDHRYDGGCAICRAGDAPEALLALLLAAVKELHP